MGDITVNFSRAEFACKCGCGFDDVNLLLVADLQEMRDYYDAPITITSGCRCDDHNNRCGGGKQSQHLLGNAADIIVDGVKASVVASFAENYLEMPGVGRYDGWTHVDVRDGGPARWG